MGTAAAENIAIQVDASANTDALSTARNDVTALGRAAKESAAEMAQGFTFADESTQKFAARLQESEEGVERSRGAARGLALEFSHLSMAAIEGEGSTMGLIRAVGLATTEMAEMSGVAELAAGASVLGAVAVAVSTLIALFSTAAEKNEKFNDSLSEMSGHSSSYIEAEAKRELGRLKDVRAQIKENDEAIAKDRDAINFMGTNPIEAIIHGIDMHDREKENNEKLDLVKDLQERQFALDDLAKERKKKENEDALRDADRLAKEQERILEENARKAADLDARMTEERSTALDKVNLSEEGQAIQRAIREEQRREAEIRALQVSEDEKTKLIILAQEDRDAQIRAIRKAAKDKEDSEEKRRQEEEKRRAEQARAEQVRAIEQSMDAGIRAHESYAQVATKTLLTPIEKYLESEAAKQLVAAAGDAADFNFIGAAAHTAVAALALEGARKVADIGGLNSSGGGGGGGGSYGSGGGSLTPKDQQGSGAVTVVLQTVDPYSSQKIGEVSYYLNRSGQLNRPIYVPPTRGVAPVGG